MLLKDQGTVIGPVTAINCGAGLSATRALGVGTIVPATLSHVRATTASAGSYANASVIQYGTEVNDTLGEYVTGSTWIFTATKAGYYHVIAAITAASQSYTAGNAIHLSVEKNSATFAFGSRPFAPTTASWVLTSSVATTMLLAVGDTIRIVIHHDRGAGNVTLQADALYNYLTIDRLF